MKNIAKVGAAGLAAAALIALAGCSSGAATPESSAAASTVDPALVSAAKAEGGLNLYGDANETTLTSWTQEFTKAYGIPVTILRLPGSQLAQRFMQEESAGQHVADIFSITDRPSMDAAVSAGYILNYTPADGSDYPASSSKAGYYYPVQNGSYQTIAYNTSNLTADQIKEIQDDPIKAAGDPQFAGHVGVNMPQSSQQIAAWYYDVAEGKASSTYGWSALQAIAANKPLIQSSATLVQSLVQGEVSIAVGITDSLEFSYVQQGAPIQFVYPNPTVGSTFSVGAVQSAAHPNAAKLFMEWATSPAANEAYTTITQTTPLNSQVADNRDVLQLDWYKQPDAANVWTDFITDQTFLTAAAANGPFLAKWNQTFGYSG